MNSVQKSTIHQAPFYLEQALNILPPEIWLNIFSNLSSKDVAACMLSCSELRDVGTVFWKRVFVQKFGQIEQTILAEESTIRSWRQNYQLGDLIPFFQNLLNVMYKNLLIYRDYTFELDKKEIIVRHNKRGFRLKGDNSHEFTHISVFGDSLFGLSKNGEIVQWDYKERRLQRVIPTEFSRSKHKNRLVINSRSAFIVEESSIFIKFMGSPICEVISYDQEETTSRMYNIPGDLEEMQVTKEGNKVYFLEYDRIKVFDLSTEQIEEHPFLENQSGRLVKREGCIFKDKKIVYIASFNKYETVGLLSPDASYSQDRRISLIDLESEQKKPRFFYCSRIPKLMVVVNNSLIGAHLVNGPADYRNIELEVFDLRNCVTSPFLGYELSEFWGKIHKGLIIQNVIDTESETINLSIVSQLISSIAEQSMHITS